jgi:hypothetical protein
VPPNVGSPTPGQRCSIIHRSAILAFGAAGLLGILFSQLEDDD